jgi:hypothetical protein
MKRDDAQRWTFRVPTPLGITQSTYEFVDDSLNFTSDDPMGASETLPWASIQQGCTAIMAGMGGRGVPQMAGWIPSQLEWLLVSRTVGGGKPFMRVLPQGPDRAALVTALQARLGPARWIGEGLPVTDAQQRLGMAGGSGTLKGFGIVFGAMACLVGLLFLLGLLAHPVIFTPLGFLIGGWTCREGLAGLRDAISVANTPTAKASSAAVGLVKLEGRAITDHPSPAGFTGRPSVWWDVTVSLWYEDSDKNGAWQQVAARYGGNSEVIELEDDSGRVPIWLKDATLLLSARAWDSEKDELPAQGLALLDELGFPWTRNKSMRVVEQCLEANGRLYVLGTLDERGHVAAAEPLRGSDRWVHLLRSGEWRRALVASVPAPVRIVVAAVIGYIDMMVKLGRGGERPKASGVQEEPPAIAETALLVWKGRSGRPFVVSNLPETAALAGLRRRSLWTFVAGNVVLCFTLYQLVAFLLA